MKNIKLENGEFVYDCEASDCSNPGEPHRVNINRVMAALEACLDEFYHARDPRLEEIFVLLSYFWTTQFDGENKDKIPETAPWDPELEKLTKTLAKHYGQDYSRKEKVDKDYLN